MSNKIIELLNSENFKDRMKGEYLFVKNKYDKLHDMIVRYEAGTLEFKPTCNLDILKRQASAMANYIYSLEVRAQIEDVDLNE